MPRVIGIDPGTISIDLCGLDDGHLFLDQSVRTADALAEPSRLVRLLEAAAPLDLVAGPSGYGLPLIAAQDLTEPDLRLAYLIAEGESGGIGGLRSLMRALARTALPVVLTPGVIHLPSVPAHRKVNRIDMGTADKLCAVVLAVQEQAHRRRCEPRDVSLILLELGGAFTAAIAVEGGQVVDGIGGTSGPLGIRSGGAFDGEVAYVAGAVTKEMLFSGGVVSMAGPGDADALAFAAPATPGSRTAWQAYVESALKAVAALRVSVPHPSEVVLSGRLARLPGLHEELTYRLSGITGGAAVHVLSGVAAVAKQAAQGAALLADGLAGGTTAAVVEALRIREASGTVLDHLHVISPAVARARLGID